MNMTKKATGLFDEFKAFAFKGNVVDLAVGVMIGGAFGKIIDALVKSVIMPLIGALLPGDQGYLGWKLIINGKAVPYGIFIGEVVNFLIVSLVLFIFIVKFLGWVIRSKKAVVALTKQEQLLTEIRDLLQKQA